ncbi:WD repeat-containing protein 44-like protein [Tanacetum coccineum]
MKLGKSVSADQLDLNDDDDDDDDVISRVVVRSKSVDDHDNIRLIVDNNNENVDNNNNNIRNVLDKSPSVNGKPPTGKGVRRSEEIVNVDENVDCMIKNLDNGEEFVVNDVREDGMCGNLKEVGTGRHLTMEEFEICVGHSPIVQELMRRQNVESGSEILGVDGSGSGGSGSKAKKKGSWLKSIKNVASSVTGGGSKERRSSDERDTSSEKGGRRSSSATDDSQDASFHGPERVRVRQYGKSCKDLTAMYKSQEIQAHNGSIWTIKFSLDGKYLASAGEDCLIHIWQCSQISDIYLAKVVTLALIGKAIILFDKTEEWKHSLE